MYAFFCFRFGLCNVWHKHNELQNIKSCNYLRLWFTFTSKYQSIEIVFTQVFLDFWQCCTIAVQWKKRMTKLTAHIKEILHCSIFSFILIQSGRHWIGVWESATVSLYFFSIGMITTHIRTQQINIHVILLSPPPSHLRTSQSLSAHPLALCYYFYGSFILMGGRGGCFPLSPITIATAAVGCHRSLYNIAR